jgi:hypothetical protein
VSYRQLIALTRNAKFITSLKQGAFFGFCVNAHLPVNSRAAAMYTAAYDERYRATLDPIPDAFFDHRLRTNRT